MKASWSVSAVTWLSSPPTKRVAFSRVWSDIVFWILCCVCLPRFDLFMRESDLIFSIISALGLNVIYHESTGLFKTCMSSGLAPLKQLFSRTDQVRVGGEVTT